MIDLEGISFFFGKVADQLPPLAAGWNYVEAADDFLSARGPGDSLFFVSCHRGNYQIVPRVVSRGVDGARGILVAAGEAYADTENPAPLPTAARGELS